ncbi:glycoside hydrolase family 97 N-terminal domain-containing protein [Spirosoma telluris]|uniref:glycoside hydrolase family 97 N-terminal domain-containing protein n=1 Tax=Spirosoma telluris TaxID=2183553 RepID=UPI002FC3468F
MPGRSALYGWLISLYFISSIVAAPTPKTYQASSPDQTTRIEIAIDDHKALAYRVWFANEPVLNWSVLGFKLNNVAVGPNAVVKKQRTETHTESFAWRLGENDVIHNNYTELTLDCVSGSVSYRLIARVFNGSVAFRYVIPQQARSTPGKIRQEHTTFALPSDFTIYQYKEETVFTPTAVADLQKTCDFPATLTNGRLFLSIGEADNTCYTKAVLTKGATPNTLAVEFGKDSVLTNDTCHPPGEPLA